MECLETLALIVCNTPSKTLTAQYLASNKHLDVRREEKSKDGPDHHDQEYNSRLFRPISICDPTGDDEANDLARASSVGQTRLPCRRDLILLVLFVPVAVLLVENWRSVKVAEEREIIALCKRLVGGNIEYRLQTSYP
jgi:hypothetical protein